MIKVSSGELYSESRGTGEPLILLHCGYADSRTWKYQLEALSKKFSVITYDQRGSGQSSIPTLPFSHIEDLREVLDSFGLKSAHLLGHSIGGQIALSFAAVYPSRVKRLMVLAPGLDGYEWSKDYQDWAKDLMVDPSPSLIATKILGSGMCSTIRRDPKLNQELKAIVQENIEKLLTWKTFEMKWSVPAANQILPQITAPCFAMVGDQDLPDIQNIVQLLKVGISNIKTRVLAGADHMINVELPEIFNPAVIDFFSN